ncbi:hypothetical protein P8C59_000444 [Phyllachora maydis]|uniref:Uncharacterized protein n=1 Tax=Phyllachora maydis TaxID=1825666 RepID=A0AAD9MAD0_9PEZI|nr:hypothetical protein P8C59_000444 [Phyllachora maydis]
MAIFGMKSSASVIESILYDWKGGLDDDTFTTLSLLDLFTACILESRLGQDRAGRLRSLMRVADHLAESILQQDARLTKSRPYLQWLLSRAALAACMAPGKPLNGHQMPGFAGLLLDVGPGVQLPLYAPIVTYSIQLPYSFPNLVLQSSKTKWGHSRKTFRVDRTPAAAMRTSPAATLLCACLAVLTASPAALADAHYQPWYLADYDGRIPQQPGDGYNYSISFKISDPNTVGSSVSTDILVSQQWVQLDPSATDIYERAMSVQQHDGDYRTWDVVFEMNDSPIPGNPPYNSPVVDFAVGITLTYPQEDGGGR